MKYNIVSGISLFSSVFLCPVIISPRINFLSGFLEQFLAGMQHLRSANLPLVLEG